MTSIHSLRALIRCHTLVVHLTHRGVHAMLAEERISYLLCRPEWPCRRRVLPGPPRCHCQRGHGSMSLSALAHFGCVVILHISCHHVLLCTPHHIPLNCDHHPPAHPLQQTYGTAFAAVDLLSIARNCYLFCPLGTSYPHSLPVHARTRFRSHCCYARIIKFPISC